MSKQRVPTTMVQQAASATAAHLKTALADIEGLGNLPGTKKNRRHVLAGGYIHGTLLALSRTLPLVTGGAAERSVIAAIGVYGRIHDVFEEAGAFDESMERLRKLLADLERQSGPEIDAQAARAMDALGKGRYATA